MNLKKILKKSKFLRFINKKYKCYELKTQLSALAREYAARASACNYVYDAGAAVAEFKSRHRCYRSDFKPASPGSLRVFWLGSNKNQDELGFFQALNRQAKVTAFQNVDGEYGILAGNGLYSFAEIRNFNGKALVEQVKNAHFSEGIDVLIGQMWANLIPKESLIEIQSMGIPVINIAMDDRLPGHWGSLMGIRLGSVGLLPGLDIVLTTCSETCMWYGVEGCPALFWPLASDPVLFSSDDNDNKDIDVLFVGNRYGVRNKIVSYLINNGINIKCYGFGWPNGYVDARQNIALSKRARIILGVGTVGHCEDVYTIKLRDFDAMMTGALYLTHRNRDLSRIFKEGEEIEFYETPQEALKKIRFYLEHSTERKRIGLAGKLNASKSHSWDIRLSRTFQQLGLQLA